MRGYFMFNEEITKSLKFSNLSAMAQLLYFKLGAETDSEGFVENPYNILKLGGFSIDDLKSLEEKGFIIVDDYGSIVITHFHINNLQRYERMKKSNLEEFRNSLLIDNDLSYTRKANKETTIWYPLFQFVAKAQRKYSAYSCYNDVLKMINANKGFIAINVKAKKCIEDGLNDDLWKFISILNNTSIQYDSYSKQYSIFNIQYSIFNTQYSILNIQYAGSEQNASEMLANKNEEDLDLDIFEKGYEF